MGLMSAIGPAVAQTQLWGLQIGTSLSDGAYALAADGAGGVFVAGTTQGSLGGPHVGLADAWLARYDASGMQTWIDQVGSPATEYVEALAAGGGGAVYVAGTTLGDLGGTNAGGVDPRDIWLARYDATGRPTWIRQLGTNRIDNGLALAADDAGGVFVGGETLGDLGEPNAGEYDAWLARYDSAGTRTWIRQFGTDQGEQLRALAFDGAGGVFAAGYTNGSLGGPSAGLNDAWLARYDRDGIRLWIRQFGANNSEFANALAADGAGGVFVAGIIYTGLPGLGAPQFWDVLLARYDSNGNQAWMRQWGSSLEDRALAAAPAGAAGVFVGGNTSGNFAAPMAGGVYDAWMSRCDGDGNQTWVRQLGTSTQDLTYALAADGVDGFYAAGVTQSALVGPYAGGSADAWLVRYGDACYPDCNGDGSLTVADFGCFQTKFVAADPYADCNADGQRTVADFGCFQTKFVAGCP